MDIYGLILVLYNQLKIILFIIEELKIKNND